MQGTATAARGIGRGRSRDRRLRYAQLVEARWSARRCISHWRWLDEGRRWNKRSGCSAGRNWFSRVTVARRLKAASARWLRDRSKMTRAIGKAEACMAAGPGERRREGG